MASGYRRLKINTQERAVSTDINRLQTFSGQDKAEMLRYALNVYGSDDLDAGGVLTEPNALETPLRAEIINGLMVSPGVASLAISILPGVLCALAPDAAVDESNYKYVRDPVGSTGVLTMTANASGSTRIDVIECRVNPTEATVNDNRDIFDSTTGLFVATSVAKEIKGQLEYRVRLGTPAAGYPAAAAGWLPLAVASVPTATVTNDTITFWDVRPLLSDRADGGYNLTRDLPLVGNVQLSFDHETDTTKLLVRGSVNVVNQAGRRLGGRMRRGTPGTDAEYIDLKDAANQSGTLGANDLAHFYLLTPFGLPRWAKYTNAPSARVPRSPRGIPVLTDVVAQHQRNVPASPITIPTSTGLVGTTSSATLVAIIPTGANAGDLYSGVVNDREQLFLVGPTNTANVALELIPATALAATQAYWDLTRDYNFPRAAKSLFVTMDVYWTVPATVLNALQPGTLGFGTAFVGAQLTRIRIPAMTFNNSFGVVNVFGMSWQGWVDLASVSFPGVDDLVVTRRLQYDFAMTGAALLTTGNLSINGWKI
jgi:hypothetical protein